MGRVVIIDSRMSRLGGRWEDREIRRYEDKEIRGYEDRANMEGKKYKVEKKDKKVPLWRGMEKQMESKSLFQIFSISSFYVFFPHFSLLFVPLSSDKLTHRASNGRKILQKYQDKRFETGSKGFLNEKVDFGIYFWLYRYVTSKHIEYKFYNCPCQEYNHNTDNSIDDNFSSFCISLIPTSVSQYEESTPHCIDDSEYSKQRKEVCDKFLYRIYRIVIVGSFESSIYSFFAKIDFSESVLCAQYKSYRTICDFFKHR